MFFYIVKDIEDLKKAKREYQKRNPHFKDTSFSIKKCIFQDFKKNNYKFDKSNN